MIEGSRIEVLSRQRYLLLAPFTVCHVRPYMPLPLSLIDQQPIYALEYFTSRPRTLFKMEYRLNHTRTWGIFVPELAGYRQETEAFVGAISLSQRQDQPEAQILKAGELGITLFRPEWVGRGIGTLAQLAVSHVALDEGAQAVMAQTSERNLAEQRALAKAGFTYLRPSSKLFRFIDGSVGPMQQWWLMGEEALAATEHTPHYEALAAGRQAFLAATAQLSIRTT